MARILVWATFKSQVLFFILFRGVVSFCPSSFWTALAKGPLPALVQASSTRQGSARLSGVQEHSMLLWLLHQPRPTTEMRSVLGRQKPFKYVRCFNLILGGLFKLLLAWKSLRLLVLSKTLLVLMFFSLLVLFLFQ